LRVNLGLLLNQSSNLSAEDEGLLAGLRAGAENAYEELIQRYQTPAYNLAFRLLGDSGDACDVVQEVFLKVFRGVNQFRGESSVKTWLTGIAINTIRDHLRSNRYRFWRQVRSTAIDVQEMSSFIAADGLNPEGLLLAREQLKHIARALEKLSRNQKTVFLMKFSEEMTVAEVQRQACELLARMKQAGHPYILGSECDVLSVPGAERTIREKVKAFLNV